MGGRYHWGGPTPAPDASQITALALSLADESRPPGPAQPATVETFRAAYRRLEPVIRRLHQQKTFDDYHVATYYAQLGDRDRAMQFLDRAATRTPAVSFILVDPRIDSVRGDARFHALLVTNVRRPAKESLVTAPKRD